MAMEDAEQPLLSPRLVGEDSHHQEQLLSRLSNTTFTAGIDDIPPINGVRDFFREYLIESKKLWFLAGPAIFTSLCRYSLGAITQVFSGQVGTLALAAVSVENSVIAGFSFGVMLGMGSALETLCGQAFGAGQVGMLGVYMQRSWVILNSTALMLSLLYIFASKFLRVIGQTESISKAAGMFAMWMLPQLFAYAFNFPMAKFLQAQSKIMVMAVIAGVALVLHTVLSWLLMLKLGWGLAGAAVVLNMSWIFIVVAQFLYIISGACDRTWTGFSWKAFQHLWGFVRLSLASAVMLCLEVWYFMALILFAGYLTNAEVSVDALSICMNILGWTIMVAMGMNAAISVRVSNELGAGHPRTAKFSLLVAVSYSFMIGMAVGAGWQTAVAYVNITCYYLFGVPLGLTLGFLLHMGVKGIWCGMLTGTVVQTCVLLGMIYKTNWNKEASMAGERIKKWGGDVDTKETNMLKNSNN
ncbi:protein DETOXIFICATION 29-like isoform X2 [Gossypium arboreum]|uniref:protein DETOXIFICATION 29-like isoform X2 n=1 Tax=Gossypium arboreum TaxID=29729 RepID=UPI0022F1549F|nr:protein DETOXIFICATION 29-like isoform X2 [Gossypium arboreum]